MNLPKCGPTAKAYSTSVVAVIPSCSHILMVVGFLWWLVSPPVIVLTLLRSFKIYFFGLLIHTTLYDA